MSLAREARRQWAAGELTFHAAVYLVALGMDDGADRDLLIDLAVAAERQAKLTTDESANAANRQNVKVGP